MNLALTLGNVSQQTKVICNPSSSSVLRWTYSPYAETEAPLDPRPFKSTASGGVIFDEAKMEVRRPYPIKVGDLWFVSVRHSEKDGDVAIYTLE